MSPRRSIEEYRLAYNMIERVKGRIPLYLEQEFTDSLSDTIRFDRYFRDPELTEWAKSK